MSTIASIQIGLSSRLLDIGIKQETVVKNLIEVAEMRPGVLFYEVINGDVYEFFHDSDDKVVKVQKGNSLNPDVSEKEIIETWNKDFGSYCFSIYDEYEAVFNELGFILPLYEGDYFSKRLSFMCISKGVIGLLDAYSYAPDFEAKEVMGAKDLKSSFLKRLDAAQRCCFLVTLGNTNEFYE